MSTVERNASSAVLERVQNARWRFQPRFTILLEASGPSGELEQTIESVERQLYAAWDILVLTDEKFSPPLALTADPRICVLRIDTTESETPFSAGVAFARGDYLIPISAGNVLSASSLFHFAEAIEATPSAAVLYGDQDELNVDGRRRKPWFKPSWNREMFLAHDYVSNIVAIRTELARAYFRRTQAKGADLTSLLLALTEIDANTVIHIPHILCHVPPTTAPADCDRLSSVSLVVESLGATCAPGPFGTTKVVWPLPSKLPLVTVIVPTRDRLDLLHACIEGVLNKTAYAPLELLIVDNGSSAPETLAYLADLDQRRGVRILPYERPYNFSAINNFAARAARGSYLCLLNNDTEVLDENWLVEMMRYAVRPEVGAVGAKLLYGDGTIQHAGVVVGIGGAAGHAHRYSASDEPGYFRQAHVAQFVSAVTAACLVIQKRKFDEVGGLDEEHLAVAFNDVDFCLKLQARGYRNVYVPHAVLLHHESKSRGSDASPKNIQRYMRELRVLQERWGTKDYLDPLHNPNLDRYSESFIVGL